MQEQKDIGRHAGSWRRAGASLLARVVDVTHAGRASAISALWRRAWAGYAVLSMMLMLGVASSVRAETTTYYVTNAQGTVVAEMDSGSNVTYEATYRPYGQQQTGAPQAGPGYTGHVNDPDTGLVYMQARYYDPTIGRFLSTDAAGSTAGNTFDFNAYTYAYNNPVINTDPTGNEAPCVSLNQACTSDRGYAQVEHATGTGALALSHGLNWVDVNVATPLAGSGIEPAAPADELLLASSSLLSTFAKSIGVVDEAAPLLDEGSSASQILKANKIAGDAFEAKTVSKLQETHSDVVSQVTVKTESGVKTRLDIMGRDSNGSIVCVECKSSSTAPLTPNQRAAFPEIGRSGAVVVGRGKPGFPGGTQIPPTNVRIIRP